MTDPGWEASLEAVLGHPPPFADRQLEQMQDLEIRNVRSLDGLRKLRSLRTLGLTACDLPSLSSLAELPTLTTLTVSDSLIGGLHPLAGHPALRILVLKNVDVSDVTPLLEIPSLTLATVKAAPLREPEAEETLRRLSEEREVAVRMDPPPVADLNRRLGSRGWPAGFLTEKRLSLLCRRGYGVQTYGKDAVEINLDALSALLDDPGADLENTLQRFRNA